jgi:hypothetical protein
MRTKVDGHLRGLAYSRAEGQDSGQKEGAPISQITSNPPSLDAGNIPGLRREMLLVLLMHTAASTPHACTDVIPRISRIRSVEDFEERTGDNAPTDRVVRIALVASAALPYSERRMQDRILEGSGYRSERNSR